MKALRRSRRLGGYAAVVLGVAGTALTGAGTARAGVFPARAAVASGGGASNLTPAQVANSTGVVRVSAGVGSSLAIHPALLVIHPA
jgi:hypothetical protein